eukprot:3350720-Pyramimonas_sp.AAC.1
MIRSQTHKKAQSSVDAIKHEVGATAAAMSERLDAIKWTSELQQLLEDPASNRDALLERVTAPTITP